MGKRNPTIVYVVGNKESLKTNQWMAMTNDYTQAELFAAENGLDTIKEVEVKPQRGGRKRAGN